MKTIYLSLLCLTANFAFADTVRIGSVDTAFALGKNHKVIVERFDDPKVDNVSCYISRAVSGGIMGTVGLASDPAKMSIACRATGMVKINENIDRTQKGELVFSERVSALFKTIRVTRFYDQTKDSLVYLIWSTKLIDGSPFNNVTAIPIKP